jgi:hypothetical protein
MSSKGLVGKFEGKELFGRLTGTAVGIILK